MTRQEQIKEIKQVLIKTCKRCRSSEEDYMQSKYAEALCNARYRKLPEDAIVLTKEEYKSLRQSLTQTTNRECELADRARALLHECDVLKIDLEKTRKETAREILDIGKKLYEMSYHKSNAMPRLIEWIKAEYGVDLGSSAV